MARAAVPRVDEDVAPPATALPPLALPEALEPARTRSREVTHAFIAAAGAAYIAVLLAADRYASYPEQLALGALTWAVLILWLTRIPVSRRAQALGVIIFATIGEICGSLIWGLYTYRLENLPMFVPPAHGIVFLTGVSVAVALTRHARAVVAVAAVAAIAWGTLGLLGIPRLDIAGALGIPLLLLFFWRSANRAVYAGVFIVVAALEFYGTAIGTWRWQAELPHLGIPNGNPPSGVASGYIWFDVMALLIAPFLVPLVSRRGPRTRRGGEPPHRTSTRA